MPLRRNKPACRSSASRSYPVAGSRPVEPSPRIEGAADTTRFVTQAMIGLERPVLTSPGSAEAPRQRGVRERTGIEITENTCSHRHCS